MSIEDIATEAAKAAVDRLVNDLIGALEGDRAVVIDIRNHTDDLLQKTGEHISHGGWGMPPDQQIPGQKASVISAESSGFLTGTEGRLTYAGNGYQVVVYWDNPFVGGNSCDFTLSGTNSDNYRSTHECGAGNHAHMAYELFPLGAAQLDWRYCRKCGSMFYNGFPNDKGHCQQDGGDHVAAGFNFVLLHDVAGSDQRQTDWRYCEKCNALYYDGFPQKGHCPADGQGDWRFCEKCNALYYDGFPDNKGHCPAGGAHQAAGFNFVLPHDLSGPGQTDWRYCEKCGSMYYDGFPQKGQCPAGGGHQAAGFNFAVPHDIAGSDQRQVDWRFCEKCSSLYYDGFPNKGHCSAGGAHQPAGFNFVLPHDISSVPGHQPAGFNFVLLHDVQGSGQTDWRYCEKCGSMFYDGFPDNKGRCPADNGSHQAAGFVFSLSYT